MNTLDQWEAHAKGCLMANENKLGASNTKILALIDLVRKKDDALSNIFQHNEEFGAVNYIRVQSKGALALTEELK